MMRKGQRLPIDMRIVHRISLLERISYTHWHFATMPAEETAHRIGKSLFRLAQESGYKPNEDDNVPYTL